MSDDLVERVAEKAKPVAWRSRLCFDEYIGSWNYSDDKPPPRSGGWEVQPLYAAPSRRCDAQLGLLQKIYQAAHIGFTVKKRDPIADSLAKDHLIECRRSTNDTETWWITDKGKTYLGAGCTALSETKPAQGEVS